MIKDEINAPRARSSRKHAVQTLRFLPLIFILQPVGDSRYPRWAVGYGVASQNHEPQWARTSQRTALLPRRAVAE